METLNGPEPGAFVPVLDGRPALGGAMKIVILLASVSTVAGLGTANSVMADDKRMGDREIVASATAKKTTPAQRHNAPRQIACTIDGCHPIPPGCHPETGYNWDGIPTGFDIVVCPRRRDRRD